MKIAMLTSGVSLPGWATLRSCRFVVPSWDSRLHSGTTDGVAVKVRQPDPE